MGKASLLPLTNGQQISDTYKGVQDSMGAQKDLLTALQQQNGLGNQSQVYSQLQGIANGTGPNPAQAMLNQATGQNVANQAALMAGQRGASSNIGLLARQAAQQGAATQQQAVGQGASMQAQQALNAINAAGNMANIQAGNQIGQTNANTAAQQAEQSNILNIGSKLNEQNQKNQDVANNAIVGGIGAIGKTVSNLGSLFEGLAEGGEVSSDEFVTQKSSAPLSSSPSSSSLSAKDISAPIGSQSTPKSRFGNFLSSVEVPMASGVSSDMASTISESIPDLIGSRGKKGDNGLRSGQSGLIGLIDKKLNPNQYEAKGGDIHDYRSGGKVKASSNKQKAVKPGDDYANDKIPAILSEHEIVIPRSITMGKDPVNGAAQFVSAVIAKRKLKGK